MFQQTFEAVFEQVEHQFKPLGALVIGIGYVVPDIFAAKVGHAIEFVLRLSVGSDARGAFLIGVVHNHDHVEVQEIVVRKFARTVRQCVSAVRGRRSHACIGHPKRKLCFLRKA